MRAGPRATLVVGLTGGIASGKTYVAGALAERGAVWIDADRIAREVVEPGTPALEAIAERFGADLLDDSGALRRKALGAIVFADADALRALEAIVHPAIRAEIRRRIADAQHAGRAVALVDAALLCEMGLDREVDRVVALFTPHEVRIARIAARDGLGPDAAAARIAAQAPDAVLRARADRAIDNDGSLAKLDAAIDALWAWLLAGAPTGGADGKAGA